MELRLDENNAILKGKIQGILTKEIAAEYFKEVSKLAEGRTIKGLLTDLREANLSADRNDMETLSQELAQFGLEGEMRRALVVKEDVSGYKVWENHNLMAGFKWIRLFVNCELAEEWLNEE